MAYAPAFHNTSVPSALSLMFCFLCLGLPGSDSKESTCSAGDKGSVPWSEDSLEKEMQALLYSCLENSKDRGA